MDIGYFENVKHKGHIKQDTCIKIGLSPWNGKLFISTTFNSFIIENVLLVGYHLYPPLQLVIYIKHLFLCPFYLLTGFIS